MRHTFPGHRPNPCLATGLIEKPVQPFDQCRKIGQGQLEVMIYIIHDGLGPLMLHTKFRRNRLTGSAVEAFFKVCAI